MAEVKVPFGLDGVAMSKIDWKLAIARVSQDLRSDFIYAPHISFIYAKAGVELIDEVKSALASGKYSPGVPVTIEVPKSFRIRVAVKPERLGPSFSRPGSILLPHDRLLYQALADQATQIVAAKTDHTRSFSHRLGAPDSVSMFLPTRTCWSALQSALSQHSKGDRVKYILKIDVANYFGSMNLHTLINVLNDSGYASELSGRLEAVLTSYTSLRSSRGILQGMFPSDLFGNFYMEPIDRFLNEYGVKAARYVDDIYVFLDSVETAQKLLGQLIPKLRYYDLVLNEAKCMIIPKGQLQAEEPDAKFLDEEDVLDSLLELVVDGELSDWQKMWILAALSQAVEHADASVKVAMDLLQDANRHESLRAVAAIFVGRFGDHSRRLTLSSVYPTVSPYIQSAIYFSSRRWRKAERLTAKNNWGSHGQLNQLLTQALEKK